MIKKIETPSPDIQALSAVGYLTREDYTEHIVPIIKQARDSGEKIKFLFQFGPEFEGFSPAAAWEDFKVGIHFINSFSRIAVVTDRGWITNLSNMFGHLIPCTVKTFANDSLEDALAWLDSGAIGFEHHLVEEGKYVQLEVTAPLTADNFYLLSQTVDNWLNEGKELNGLLIRAKKFPGWDDLGSLVAHIDFVKNHHKKIQKVAFVSNSDLARFMPQIAKHFVKAEIKQFPYEDIENAKAWVHE